MPSLPILLFLLGVLVVSVVVSAYLLRRGRPEPGETSDEALEEARALRERVDTLYVGSDDVQKRAKRLEQMLEVQRRDQRRTRGS